MPYPGLLSCGHILVTTSTFAGRSVWAGITHTFGHMDGGCLSRRDRTSGLRFRPTLGSHPTQPASPRSPVCGLPLLVWLGRRLSGPTHVSCWQTLHTTESDIAESRNGSDTTGGDSTTSL